MSRSKDRKVIMKTSELIQEKETVSAATRRALFFRGR